MASYGVVTTQRPVFPPVSPGPRFLENGALFNTDAATVLRYNPLDRGIAIQFCTIPPKLLLRGNTLLTVRLSWSRLCRWVLWRELHLCSIRCQTRRTALSHVEPIGMRRVGNDASIAPWIIRISTVFVHVGHGAVTFVVTLRAFSTPPIPSVWEINQIFNPGCCKIV